MKKLPNLISWLGGGIFSAGLLFYAFLGIYNRFWADDWCYNADFTTLGVWGSMQGYTFITHYASNRYSLTFFTMLLQLWDVFSAQITAVLVVALWFGALTLVVRGLNRLFNLQWNTALTLLVTTAIEYYALYLAPNQYRSLFFRSSVLTYTAPLLSFIAIFGLFLWRMNHEKPSRLFLFLIGPAAFLAAGFSESGCAYLGAAVGILWLAALIFRKRNQAWAVRIFIPASIALISVFLAMLVLVLSPAIAARHTGYPDPINPLLLPVLSLTYSFDFIRDSLRGLILPHLVFSLLFLLIPFLSPAADGRARFGLAHSLKAMVVIASLAVLLIAAIQIPAIYIENGPPASKALISARFILLFALAAIFWLAGSWLTTYFKGAYRQALVLLILVPLLYTLRPIWLKYEELPRFVERAQIWDARHASIRLAAAQGLKGIDVKGIDSAYLGHTLDFKEKPTFWTNACAEIYYGIDEIRATLP